jgi:hypothetical protein
MPIGEVQFTPDTCVAARRLLNLPQMTLAKTSGVEVFAIINFERGRRILSSHEVSSIKRALERTGVNFFAEEPALTPEAAARTDLAHAVEFYERLKAVLRDRRLV